MSVKSYDLSIMTTLRSAEATGASSTQNTGKKIVSTTTTIEPLFRFNPATMASEKVGTQETGKKTVYEDGSYSETQSNGAVRNYDANGKWVSGVSKDGVAYSYTFDEENGQITCNYEDGRIEICNDKYQTVTTIIPGEAGADADGKHYQFYQTKNSDSSAQTKMYDDGSFVRNVYTRDGSLYKVITQDADGNYEEKFPNNEVRRYNADDVEIGGTSNGVNYTCMYEDGTLTQKEYDNGNLRLYNEDNTQTLYDKDNNWIGGSRSDLGGEYVVTYNDDGSYELSGTQKGYGNKNYNASVLYNAEGMPISGRENGTGITWTNTYNDDGSLKTEYSSGQYYVTGADGKLQGGRVAGGSEYTIEYNDDGTYTATYKDGIVAKYQADGTYISHEVTEVDKMSGKEANNWVKQYQKEHNCDKDTARRNFEQIFGYETPLTNSQKVGKFFKKVGDVAADIGIGTLGALAGATHAANMHLRHMPPPPPGR